MPSWPGKRPVNSNGLFSFHIIAYIRFFPVGSEPSPKNNIFSVELEKKRFGGERREYLFGRRFSLVGLRHYGRNNLAAALSG